MTSREYFEAASAAQRRITGCIASIARMRSMEGARAQRYDVQGKGSGVSDPMRRTDSRIDYEARAASELSALYDEVERAREVCRGYSASNPCSLGGTLIQLHYIDLMTWREAASSVGMSESGARAEASAALDWMDFNGLAATRDGMGQAALF